MITLFGSGGARSRHRSSNYKSDNPFFDFIKQYFLVIIGLIVAIPFILKYYKKQEGEFKEADLVADEKTLEVANENPVTRLQGLNKITDRVDLQDIARNIAYNFGTNIRVKNSGFIAMLDPRGWTENDEKAYNQLKKINYIKSRDLVIKLYYFQTRRNLMNDVKTLLDEEYINKLPLFK